MTRIKSSNVQLGSSYVLPIENVLKDEETKLEKMIKAAELQKQQLIASGQKQAEEIVAQARQLLEEAKVNGEKYLQETTKQANDESAGIRDAAQKEGYEAGYSQGYNDGTASLEDKFYAMDVFSKSKFDIKHNIIKSAELDIVDLVIAIARKVCKKSLDDDIEILKSITIEAIKQLKDKENITITVNPELAEKIYSISDDLRLAIPKLKSIKVIEDSNVSADGTIVETPLSRVDSRLKTQIDEISDKMMSKHYSNIEEDDMQDAIELVDNDTVTPEAIDELQEKTKAEIFEEIKDEEMSNDSDIL